MIEWKGAICLHCLLREAQTALGRLLVDALWQESGRERWFRADAARSGEGGGGDGELQEAVERVFGDQPRIQNDC